MSRPWALLLSPIWPDAYGGGLARRAWHWVAELSVDYEVLTIVVATHNRQKQGSTAVPGRVETIDALPRSSRDGLAPDWTRTSANIQSALGGLVPAAMPARIIAFRFYMHPIVAMLPIAWQTAAEMDIDDWEAETRLSLAKLAARRGRLREAYDHVVGARAYAALERTILRRYARVHVAAQEDVAPLEARAGLANVVPRPNCIADVTTSTSSVSMEANRLLFVGTLDYLPNEDAVLWLARHIAPRVRAVIPDVSIVIAGRNPPRSVLALEAQGIHYAGAPEDLSDCYAEASIVVAPIRGGGGTKLKSPEAWLYSRPLVATTHAARGYGAVDGTHVLIGDKAADFAAACVRLLRDPVLAARLAEAGHDLLRSKYLLPVALRASGKRDP